MNQEGWRETLAKCPPPVFMILPRHDSATRLAVALAWSVITPPLHVAKALRLAHL
jgi:hypothetical protein